MTSPAAGRLSRVTDEGESINTAVTRIVTWRHVLGVLLAASVVAWAATAAQATPNYDWPGMRKCGTFQAQYKIWVYAKHISCHRARRIQKEYWLAPRRRKVIHNGGTGAFGWVTLKRYPGWRCYSGAGGGSCKKGRRYASYQD